MKCHPISSTSREATLYIHDLRSPNASPQMTKNTPKIDATTSSTFEKWLKTCCSIPKFLCLGKNFEMLHHDFNHFSKVLEGNAFNLGAFLVIWVLWWGPLRSLMYSVASLDVDKIGWRFILGLAKSLGAPHYDFNHSSKVLWVCYLSDCSGWRVRWWWRLRRLKV